MEERLAEVKEEEARIADYKRQKKLEQRKRKRGERVVDDDDEDEQPATDPDMAAMMGFGGFGSSKK